MDGGRQDIDLNIRKVVLDVLSNTWKIEKVSMVSENLTEFKGCSSPKILGQDY